MAEERDELLDHDYDGIKEFDNDLPRWWLYLFYLTIAIAAFYYVYFDLGPGRFPVEKLPGQMARLEEARKMVNAVDKKTAGGDEQSLLALAVDSNRLKAGADIFTGQCAVCHGPQGQGLIGPNLTDAYWVHGGSIMDIRKVVVSGVVEKGMLAWQGVLTPDEIDSVVAYVWSRRGSNPPNPKAPEGQAVPQ